MSDRSENLRPSAVLKSEHRVIERVLRVLETLVVRSEQEQGFELESLKQCVEFFRLFADACHHAKEEDLLFPVLEERGIPREGGPIGVMLHEHSQARVLTKEMGAALTVFEGGDNGGEVRFRDAARQYLTLLVNHIYKEDNILFNMGDHVMTDADQTLLCGRFGEVGCRAFEGKHREELAAIADELEARW
jgi:hemerythrin-like domain-containing protein